MSVDFSSRVSRERTFTNGMCRCGRDGASRKGREEWKRRKSRDEDGGDVCCVWMALFIYASPPRDVTFALSDATCSVSCEGRVRAREVRVSVV